MKHLIRILFALWLCHPTIASALSLQSGQCVFGSSDIYCEGSTADAFEGIFTVTDPTADRTYTFQNLSGTVALQTGVLTDGSIPFLNSSAQLAQDNANLFFDDTNNSLGIGTLSPDTRLDVEGGAITISEIAAPGTPAAGKGVLYEKADNVFYHKSDAGVETGLNTTSQKPSGTILAGAKVIGDTCTLNGGATATCTVTVSYTSATSYVCTGSTESNTNSIQVVRTNATTVTVTSAVTLDTGVVMVICMGN